MNLLKRHLSVANLISCIALFVALSGAAYAATTIGKKSVKAQHLANGSVTAPKIRREAVTTPKIRNAAVISTKIATGAVGTTQIADGSVRSSKLGGSVVTSGKLKDGAVTTSKIGTDAVTSGKIQEGAVTTAKLSTSLNSQLPKNISYATATSASNTSEATKTATAFCPTGKQVVGGGAKVIGGDVLIAITESAPIPINADGKRIGWSAVAKEATTSTANWSVEAYAVCAEF